MAEGRRYRVIGTLGRGGFGTVYLADMLGESGFSRKVALKVLNADVAEVESIAPRLRDEARLLGMLRHRAVVQVDSLVRLDDRWTVVMEYIPGADIGKVLGEGPIPPGPTLEIMEEVAGALNAAYSAPGPSGEPLKLLHRDIKPPNILVTGTGEVKVLDFGVARAEFEGREAETRAMILGSLGYMAPERYEHEEGPGADVFAMGLMIYEMITGSVFGRSSLHPGKFETRRSAALEELRQAPEVSSEVVELVARMIEYEDSDRPTAREVERICRDLRRQLPGEWLKDWAEVVIPPLVPDPDDLAAHDFPSDIVTESGLTGAPTAELPLDGGWPGGQLPAAALSTLQPDDDDEEREGPKTWDPRFDPTAPVPPDTGVQAERDPGVPPPPPSGGPPPPPGLRRAPPPTGVVTATPAPARPVAERPPPVEPEQPPQLPAVPTFEEPRKQASALKVVVQVFTLLGIPAMVIVVAWILMFTLSCCGTLATGG